MVVTARAGRASRGGKLLDRAEVGLLFESSRERDGEVRARYPARLGVGAEGPSAEVLNRLVRRHAERVPYETWWIDQAATQPATISTLIRTAVKRRA